MKSSNKARVLHVFSSAVIRVGPTISSASQEEPSLGTRIVDSPGKVKEQRTSPSISFLVCNQCAATHRRFRFVRVPAVFGTPDPCGSCHTTAYQPPAFRDEHHRRTRLPGVAIFLPFQFHRPRPDGLRRTRPLWFLLTTAHQPPTFRDEHHRRTRLPGVARSSGHLFAIPISSFDQCVATRPTPRPPLWCLPYHCSPTANFRRDHCLRTRLLRVAALFKVHRGALAAFFIEAGRVFDRITPA